MSNTTPTPSTPKAPKPKQPADTAGQTTVIPTAVPDPAAQPAPTPVPKPKRKPLPRWTWSVGGGIVAAILFWIARDVLLFLIVVAVGFITGPKIRSMIRSWKLERERKAALAAAAAGQPTTPTTQFTATFSSGWRSGVRVAFAVILGAIGATIGCIAIWGIAGAIMKYSDFNWEGWMTYSLASLIGAAMFITFASLGNKLATKLL